MAVSLYQQGANINRELMRQLTGQPPPSRPARPRLPARDWLLRWIAAERDPRTEMDSLAGVLWHLADAWARRGQPNIVLVHYDDLSADLAGEMRGLAGRLGITVPEASWPGLVQSASFASMRASATRVVPGGGVLRSDAAFFRRGTSGAGRELLTAEELARYHAGTATMAPPDLLAWLHRES